MPEQWHTIRPTGPFHLAKTIECGQAFRWRQYEETDIGVYYEAVIGATVVNIAQVDGDILFRSGPEDPSIFRTHLENYLGINRLNIEQVYSELESDPVMADLIDMHRGLRILRQDPWECPISFILSVAAPISKIRKNVKGISREYGNRIEFNGRTHYTFPSPSTLAQADVEDLKKLRLGFKAEHVKAAARTVLDWRIPALQLDSGITLPWLAGAPYELAFVLLNELDGVGEKVADCTLLFSLDHMEAFPVDTHVRQGIQHWYPNDPDVRRLPKTNALKVGKLRNWGKNRFGRYCGYASQLIFYDNR